MQPGALVDGPMLIEADLGYQIDNMEGLSVHRGADGELVLTLVSDDNFSLLQRTLLLQFTLASDAVNRNGRAEPRPSVRAARISPPLAGFGAASSRPGA